VGLEMPITHIDVKNITVFDNANVDFSSGINLFIGENGTGKTHMLKLLYMACDFLSHKAKETNTSYYPEIFSKNGSSTNLARNLDVNIKCDAKISFGLDSVNMDFFNTNTSLEASYKLIQHNKNILELRSIFIPAKEMLSHAKGFLALNDKYSLPFDKTLVDIISNAQLPEARRVSLENQKLLDDLSKVIGGTVVMENDMFYIKKLSGIKVDFSLEAEGLRKIGLLWKLIRNGLLEKGSILFWDEPEANVNPKAIPIIVNVLLKLQEAGVQVFIATHNYLLLKAFDLHKKPINQVVFYSFYKDNDAVKVNKASELYQLKPNPIIEAYELMLDETIDNELK
jgi:predicted ATPase